MLTNAESKRLREILGDAVLDAQATLKHQPVDEVIIEILGALLSLAALVACQNARLEPEQFIAAGAAAAKITWERYGS